MRVKLSSALASPAKALSVMNLFICLASSIVFPECPSILKSITNERVWYDLKRYIAPLVAIYRAKHDPDLANCPNPILSYIIQDEPLAGVNSVSTKSTSHSFRNETDACSGMELPYECTSTGYLYAGSFITKKIDIRKFANVKRYSGYTDRW
jgi:hypothetical protein